MNWKTEIQLIDIADQKIEVTCKSCGHSRYENPYLLIKKYGLDFSYMDEVERMLVCNNRTCNGDVRIALLAEEETEGFVRGLA
jgi:hypothetical protein